MKSVLISIQPKWCELIASGKKTVEVRKTAPKLPTPFKCYIYCTKKKKRDEYGSIIFYKDPNGICVDNGEGCSPLLTGMVIGEFVCDKIMPFDVPYPAYQKELDKAILEQSCLTYYQLHRYAYHDKLYGWHISNLVIYDEPKQLSEFYKCGAVPMKDLDEELCSHCAATDYGEEKECHTPSGVWMCEGRWCDEAYQAYLDEEFSLTRAPQSWCYVEG